MESQEKRLGTPKNEKTDEIPAKLYNLREIRPEDVNYVLNSWLKSWRKQRFSQGIPSELYYPSERAAILRAVGAGVCLVAEVAGRAGRAVDVAGPGEQSGAILGWIVAHRAVNPARAVAGGGRQGRGVYPPEGGEGSPALPPSAESSSGLGVIDYVHVRKAFQGLGLARVLVGAALCVLGRQSGASGVLVSHWGDVLDAPGLSRRYGLRYWPHSFYDGGLQR